jgi:hypothetical protein
MKCLICEQEAHKKFDLPVNKCSGGSLLVRPDRLYDL